MPAPSVPLAAIRQPAFLYDAGGRVVAANDLAEALAGRRLEGMAPAGIIAHFSVRGGDGRPLPAEDLPAVRALRGEEAVDVPLELTVAGGRTVSVLATASPIREGGAVTGALAVWQDVTDRKEAGEALAGSEEKYRRVFETMTEGFVIGELIRDDDGGVVDYRYLEANPAYERLTGIPRERSLSMTIRELIPDLEDAWIEQHARVVETGEPLHWEQYNAATGGWYEVISVPAGPERFASIFLNITDRKEYDEALRAALAAAREGEQTLAALMDSVPEGITIADADRRLRMVSRFGEELLGGPHAAMTAEEVIVRWRTYQADGTTPMAEAETPLARAMQSGAPVRDAEMVQVNEAGQALRLLCNAAPIRDADGTVKGGVVAWRDVTEQRRAEAALRESEGLLSRTLALSQDGIYRRDLQTGQFVYVNPALPAMLGCSPEELSGTDPSAAIEAIHPDDRWFAGEVLNRRGDWTGRAEYRFRCRDGTYHWFAEHFAVEADEDGQPHFITGVIRDVTDRIQTEEAVRDSEARFREIFDLSRDVISRHSLKTGRFDYISPSCFEQSGWTGEELLAMDYGTLQAMIHPDDRPVVDAMGAELMASGTAEGEYRQRTRDGGYYWVSSRLRLVRDDAGVPLSLVATSLDITGRKRTEEALRESEEKYRTLFHSIDQGYFVIDVLFDEDDRPVDLYYVEANDAATRMLGQDWTGKRLSELSPDYEPYWVEIFGNVAMTGESVRLERYAAPDQRWYDFFVFRIGGPGSRRIGNTFLDITERKRAEAALQESEERMRLALTSASTVLFHQDRDLRYTWISNPNPAYAGPDVLGRTDEETLPPEDAAVLTALKRRVLGTGIGTRAEVRTTLGGVPFYYDLTLEPLTDAAGETIGVIGISHDITDLKQAEQALGRYAADLERSNEDLERFAYVSSHDLQEPLRSIVSFSQLLERRYRGRLDRDADEYIDFIVEGGMRMQALILDLLAYSRVNTTKQELVPTDVEQVMAAVERQLATALAEAGAVLTHGPLPTVMADPVQLEQVFANLISNTIKFRREGVPLAIRVSANRTGDLVEFSVRDNGIGIEPQYYDRIFTIFQRLHTKEAYPGTGIGLAIVKRIIDRHGGRIWVESVPGEGSTFFFTLPAA